ncbi:MAG: mandelate racemase/muconate lactonizing enzyme family protein [Anaerolineae bacterium]|nr:mandelate racemase/muconate lactonizing enzyme family protein [Anaerolineae bacterium]
MKITDCQVSAVKGRHWPRFPMVFVELHTDEGLVGLGEALPYQASGLLESLDHMGEALVGADPFQIERHWERFYRGGASMAALSGIETAMWDIVGQALGVPIYNLLGGACHERIHVYVDGFFREGEPTPEAYAQKALEAVALGFGALKMDVDDFLLSGKALNRGIHSTELRTVAETVCAIREAIGDDVDLGMDCHWAFDVSSAINLGKALEPYHLMWLEDPIPSGNVKALSKVRSEVDIPICTGEVLETRFAFREMLEQQAADILMPDLARAGGILEMKKIAAFADTYYVPIAPHNMMGPVATMASVHLCACIPNFRILEFQMGDVPWRDDLIDRPLVPKDGCLALPTGSGLGMRLNHKQVSRYRVN